MEEERSPVEGRNRSLRDAWLSYHGANYMNRWLEYASHYERHLPPPDSLMRPLRMLELGVQVCIFTHNSLMAYVSSHP